MFKHENGLSIFLLVLVGFNLCAYSQEKAFKVIIPSFNNENWCEKNLLSVLNQSYSNYEIIYVNDCSNDNTLQVVKNVQTNHQLGHKIKIINNDVRCGPLRNVYMPIHFLCEDDDIVIILDGDDWFEGSQVLNHYNTIFSQNDVWFVYGNYKRTDESRASSPSTCIFPDSKIGSNQRVPVWVKAPRVFYAWLFKLIKLEDLLYEGEFFKAAGDAAFSYPLLELAGKRHLFNKEVTYIYNRNNPISYFATMKKYETAVNGFILQKKPYAICNSIQNNILYQKSFDIFLIYNQATDDLEHLLSLAQNSNIGNIHILYNSSQLTISEIQQLSGHPFIAIDVHAIKQDYSLFIQNYFTYNVGYQLPDFVVITTVSGLVRNIDQLEKFSCLLQQTKAFQLTCVTGLNDYSLLPTATEYRSYILDNIYSMQLGWEPVFSDNYAVEAIVYDINELVSAGCRAPLFKDDLSLQPQLYNQLSLKAGLIAFNCLEFSAMQTSRFINELTKLQEILELLQNAIEA